MEATADGNPQVASGTTITLLTPDGNGMEYGGVVDWSSNGMEVDFKLADGVRIVSNCKYLVQEVPE